MAYLFDTPGMLWPRIIVPQSGLHLAASGAVGRNAYDDETVALDLLDLLKVEYPAVLEARYAFGLAPEAQASPLRTSQALRSSPSCSMRARPRP